MLGGQPAHQALATQGLGLFAGQMDTMAASGQLAHHGIEIPEVRVVERGEQDLHLSYL